VRSRVSVSPARKLVSVAMLAVAVGLAGCPDKAQIRHDRRWLAELTPAPLGVDQPHDGEPEVARIRVYADQDFRAQHVHWRQEIGEQLDDANQFLTPALGIRLEAVEIAPWEVRTAGRELGDVLADLEQLDPGADVPWVVGLVSSVPMVAANFEQLGIARVLGRHIVLRGFADLAEHRAFDQALPTLDGAQRDALYEGRRKHKLTVLFVHELGHTLGAAHETDPSWIMNAGYQVSMATLSDRSRQLMRVALEGRIGPRPLAPGVVAGRILTYLDENPWGGWNEDELAQVRTTLGAIATTPPATTTGDARDLPVPAAAYEQLRVAQGLAARGKFDEALAELEALISAYPSAGEIRLLVCQVRIAKDGPEAEAAVTACARAVEVNPGDPRPLFARVDALVTAGKPSAALALLPAIEAIAGDRGPAWEQLAAFYQGQTMISAAEAAIARSGAGGDHPVRGWASRLRARYGLPQDGKGKVPTADEAAYVGAVREILDLVYASKFPAAEAKARAAEKRWPATPGVLGARCDLALRQGQTAAATKLCDRAIKLWPGAAWAQYLRGVMALQRGKTAPAIVALRAAVAAEPELAAVYRTLGKALTMAHDQPAHDELDLVYQQRFGSRLPD
jgi:tetratricopeptide (TPR) repeat protein